MVLEKVLIVINLLVWSANSEYPETPSLCCTAADGVNYPINTTFTTTDCLSKCVCTHDAQLGCIPLCPSSVSKCPIGYKRGEIMYPAAAKENGCLCKKVICKALSNNAVAKTDYCQEGNDFYKPGKEFIKNCTKLCRCYKKGQARCVPLCPDDPPCPVGTTEIKLQVPIEYNHDKCKCKTKVCKALPIKDECLINEIVYKTGEDFISADCSGSCKCHPGGRIFCISLCPPEAISCEHNEATIKLLRKIPNSNCTCPTWRCLKSQQQTKVITKQEAPITKGMCTSKSGNIYQSGQVFIDQNCTLKCHCQDHGKVTCEPLCADFGSTQDCAPENQTIIHFSVLLPHGDGKSSCSCPVQICGPDVETCIVGDYVYKPGDEFVSPDCSGYCRCYPGGSVLCADLCPTHEVTCQHNEDKMYSLSAIPNSNCTCTTWECVKRVKKPLEDKCYVGEYIYQPGDDFVSADCSGYCKCHPGGTVSCNSLCPPSIIACPDDEEAVQGTQEVSGTNCTCPSWKCLKKSEAVKAASMCISKGGNVYKIGQEFTDQNCTSQCQCAAGGKITCQPLCSNITQDGAEPCTKKTILDMPVALPDDEGNNCFCPIILCEITSDKTTELSPDNTCTVGKYTYRPGEDFVSADCSGYCKCHPEGSILCVSLCPPEGITCQHYEEAVQLSREIPNSNCTCPTWKCLKKKDQCLVDGHVYQSGEDFISNDCLSRCKCLPGQVVICRTLCPPEDITCQLGEVKEQLLEKIPNSNCSCPKWKCVKKEVDEFCVIDGEKHKIGEHFVDSTCTGYCICYGSHATGCVSLCPPEPPCNPGPGEINVEFQEPVLDSNCTCQRWKCVKDQCLVDGRVYNSGEDFISNDCLSRCKCLPGQAVICKTLCPPEDITCQLGEVKEQLLEKIPNSNCSCPKWKCVKKEVDEFCVINGEKHKIGERFVDSTCTGYCRCYGPHAIGCVSLCPPVGYPPCNPGEIKVEFQEPVLDSNCTCQRWKCVKESGNWTRWSNWTACDARCGGGRRYKYRSCKNGSTCVGSNYEEEICNLTPCSVAYSINPCGSSRMKAKTASIWPRCDDNGFFVPLQCEPNISQCWCVGKWGNEVPGSRLSSQIPQC